MSIRIGLLFVLCFLGIACNKSVEPDFSYITNPHTRWQAYGFTTYSIDQHLSCFCANVGITVRVFVKDNHVVLVTEKATGDTLPSEYWRSYKTIEELFTIIQGINEDSVAEFNVTYDAKFGYPTSFYVDLSAQMADEEYQYTSANLTTVPTLIRPGY
jgi:hypothetical protein